MILLSAPRLVITKHPLCRTGEYGPTSYVESFTITNVDIESAQELVMLEKIYSLVFDKFTLYGVMPMSVHDHIYNCHVDTFVEN